MVEGRQIFLDARDPHRALVPAVRAEYAPAQGVKDLSEDLLCGARGNAAQGCYKQPQQPTHGSLAQSYSAGGKMGEMVSFEVFFLHLLTKQSDFEVKCGTGSNRCSR